MKIVILAAVVLVGAVAEPILPLFIGRGYDLLRGNPSADSIDPGFRSEVMKYTFDEGKTTQDGKYSIPDQSSVYDSTSCSLDAVSKEFTGMTNYQKILDTRVSVGFDYDGAIVKAAFSISTEYKTTYNKTVNDHTIFTSASAKCEVYELEIPTFEAMTLSDDFIAGVKKSMDEGSWVQFVEVFGTHYIYQTMLGGRMEMFTDFSEHSVQELRALDISVAEAASFSFAKFTANESVNWTKHEQEIDYFDKKANSSTAVYIGSQPPPSGNWIDWQKGVRDQPAPITYKMWVLSDLFSNIKDIDYKAAEQSFKDYLDEYCHAVNCDIPKPDPPMPPPVTVKQTMTSCYGSSVGDHFTDTQTGNPLMEVRQVLINSSIFVGSLRFLLSDGVNSEYTPNHGGSGGSDHVWSVPYGESISQIEVWYNCCDAHGIRFSTNQGTQSDIFGRTTETNVLINLEGKLVGISGYNDFQITEICFEVNSLAYPNREEVALIE